jgi:site-specific recombinase XerD
MIEELFARFDGAFSENTLRAYRSDFRHYEAWCKENNIPRLPAKSQLLARYVDELSLSKKSATIRRRIVIPPLVTEFFSRGLRRHH